MNRPVLLSAGCTEGQVADQALFPGGHPWSAGCPESVPWEKLQIDSFYVLSRKKMVELQWDAIMALNRQGSLELAHARLFSLENLHRLVALAAEKVV